MNKTEIRTLLDLLQYSTETYSSRKLFSFVDGEPMTYGLFAKKVQEVQQIIQLLGVGFGDKIAIYTHNTPNYGIVYFAVTSMGAVIVPLLPDFSPTEVENILNHSESKVLFVSSRLRSKLEGLQLDLLKSKIEIESFSILENIEVPHMENLEDRAVQADDLASIVYTSGTTGKSKGVMLTHHNLVEQVKMVHEIQPVQPNDRFLSILPLPHAYEGSLGFLLPLYAGASVYYLEKPPTPAILLPALKKIRPTYMLSVPLIVEKIFRNTILPKINKSFITRNLYKLPMGRKLIHRSAAKKLKETFGGQLVFFGIGGAKLDPVVERFLYEGKFPYAIGYGLTEAAPLLSAALTHNVKPESAGFKLNQVEFKINEPNAQTGLGELWAKSPSIMKGYYKEQELTNEVITPDGWFKTGDLVTLDRTGRLFIRGRLKNVILGSSGENIYPEEIESVINNFKYVQESLVVEQKGKLVAMVKFNYEELEKQYQMIKEELLSTMEQKRQELESKRQDLEQKIEALKYELMLYVNSRVNRFSQISMVVALSDDFEKTSTMKIKRYLYNS